MDKLIFERDFTDDDGVFISYEGEPVKIVFEIKSGMKLDYFKVICKRLASAIGYTEDDIERVFGDETSTFEEMEAQVRIKSLIKDNKYIDYAISGSE